MKVTTPHVELTETEMQIAEEIIDPDSIDVTFEGIAFIFFFF